VAWLEETSSLSVTVARELRRDLRGPVGEETPPVPTGFQVLTRRWVVAWAFA
jgi:hypothetical protein